MNEIQVNHERLLVSEERFRSTFEQAAVGIAHVAPEGTFLRINKKFCDIVGFTREEMLLRTFQDITHPDDLDADLAYMRQMLTGEITTYSMEKRYLRKDRAIVWINLTVSLVREEPGEPGYFIAVVEDITERKRIQERLRESEARYRTLTEYAPDGIFLVDATTGQFLDCNPQGLKLFGYSREKMLSFTPIDFSPPLAPDGRPIPEVLQERLESLTPGKQLIFEWVHLHADGHEIPCEIRAVLLPSSGRHVLRASMIDISERKRAEKVFEEGLRFQELVSRISTKFSSLSGVEFEHAIQAALTEVGRYFEVDTVRLYRLSPQGDVLKIRNMWRAEHLAPPREMPEIHNMTYPHLAAHYSRGGSVVFGRVDECPELPDLRKILNFFGTKAGVGAPLEIDDSGVDVFAMDKVQSEHVWPEDIVEHSRAIGKVILSAMRRREAEVELQNSYDEIKRLKDRLQEENIYLREEIDVKYKHAEIIGQSKAIKRVLRDVEHVAAMDSTVLISGETGTGKELVARAIHRLSPRRDRPMVRVNCAALPSMLVENELFGSERGAYTGAISRKIGRFEVANGSTVFLDEIGELPLELQVKLLRVLQEGEIERLGSNKTIKVDVRVIAATNRDLELEMQEGRFREDLYYRLNVFPIAVPPLRERPEDIPLLIWEFMKILRTSTGKAIDRIPQKSMEALQHYSWPGNIRELRNVLERAMIVSRGSTLRIDPPKIDSSKRSKNMSLEDIERQHILDVLEMTGGRIGGEKGAAKILDINPKTLQSRMRKLGIHRKQHFG